MVLDDHRSRPGRSHFDNPQSGNREPLALASFPDHAGVCDGRYPLCQYRQSLAFLLIPWAAQCLDHLVKQFETHRYRTAGIWLAVHVTGWFLVQGPLARYPKARYERISEYEFSEWVYQKLGLKEKFTEIREEINEKFHDDIK